MSFYWCLWVLNFCSNVFSLFSAKNISEKIKLALRFFMTENFDLGVEILCPLSYNFPCPWVLLTSVKAFASWSFQEGFFHYFFNIRTVSYCPVSLKRKGLLNIGFLCPYIIKILWGLQLIICEPNYYER